MMHALLITLIAVAEHSCWQHAFDFSVHRSYTDAHKAEHDMFQCNFHVDIYIDVTLLNIACNHI